MPSDLQTFPDGAAGSLVRGYLNTLITRFQDVCNVKNWGALGNGTTDDTAGLQAALDQCFGSVDSPHGDAAKQTNRPMFFPAGIYLVNPPAALTVSGAADNGSGLVRLTTSSIGTNYKTGHIAKVADITGSVGTAANGTWPIEVVDDTHIDLRGSTFSGTWTSGGAVTRAALQTRNVRGAHISGAGREVTQIVTATANGSIFAANGFDFSYVEDLSIFAHAGGVAFDVRADGTGTGTTGNTFERTNFSATPTLVITSPATDNTPNVTVSGDFALDDVVRMQYSSSSSFSSVTEITDTIDSTEAAADTINLTTTTLADGTYYFRARVERPSVGIGGWSNTASIAIVTSVSTTTWDPANKNTDVVLSGGNLTMAVSIDYYEGVRAIAGASTGKKIYQVTIGGANAGETYISIVNSSFVTTGGVGPTNIPGFAGGSNSVAYVNDGNIWLNGSSVLNTGASYTVGHVITICLDRDNQRLFVRRDSGNWNGNASVDPNTPSSGVDISALGAGNYYPLVYIRNYAADVQNTANFGPTFSPAAPSGYNPY